MLRQCQGKVKTRSGQYYGKVQVGPRRGLRRVKTRLRIFQGKVERQDQGKINVRLKQSKKMHKVLFWWP